MSCPHSNNPEARPETCSQCLGAVPRVVRYDPQAEKLLMDEVAVSPQLTVEQQRTKRLADQSRGKKITVVRKCSKCGKPGHTSRKCQVSVDSMRYAQSDDTEYN